MRIHTSNDAITIPFIRTALDLNADAQRIAKHVSFKVLQEHGSRSHERSFEIQLEAAVRDNGRRWGNSGSYGAGDAYTATFDEWGWMLSSLFEKDPDMQVGSGQKPVYENAEDFHRMTGDTYNLVEMQRVLSEDPEDDPYPFVIGRSGIGRCGYGRSDGESVFGRYFYSGYDKELYAAIQRWIDGKKQGNERVKYLPRTLSEYKAFAHI